VVGVVGDARRADLQRAPGPTVYMTFEQFSLPFMGVVVRTAAGPEAVARSVGAAVTALDPDLPIEEARLAVDLRERSTGQPRFRAVLVLAFAATALLLAAVGLYGLISYAVTQRVPEIGIRLALGADPGQVGRQVVIGGLKLAGLGVLLGLGGAAALTRWVQGLLFGTSPTDPLVYGGLAGLLLTIAALACYVPARRAMRVDPMIALRAE
jgi:ABC-type antimicrobial peptide transport system permease subunit